MSPGPGSPGSRSGAGGAGAAAGAASLRIGASLDLETVLQEVVDSARALTVARAAFIATMDDAGAPEDFFASGITEEQFRSLLEWPDGPRVFEHELADLPVVFISGYGRDETVARALEAGAEDYIVKPFSPTELVARVRTPAGCPGPKP